MINEPIELNRIQQQISGVTNTNATNACIGVQKVDILEKIKWKNLLKRNYL